MKRRLRAIIRERQWKALATLKRRAYSVPGGLLALFIKRLPDEVMLSMAAHTEIRRKMDYAQDNILLSINSREELKVRLNSCKKEPETIAWIETCIQKDEVLYDVGANVGAYSLVASKFFHGRVRVYAFEPSFITFTQLCKNIVINDCQDSIIPLQMGLSNKTSLEVLNYDNLIPGGALHALGEPIDYKGDVFAPVLKQHVLAYRMDDLIEQFDMPIPNHIKLDVDGTELKVLIGAQATLQNEEVKSVLLELEKGSEKESGIINFLAEKGLELHSRHKYVYGGDSGPFSKTYNYIFQRVA